MVLERRPESAHHRVRAGGIRLFVQPCASAPLRTGSHRHHHESPCRVGPARWTSASSPPGAACCASTPRCPRRSTPARARARPPADVLRGAEVPRGRRGAEDADVRPRVVGHPQPQRAHAARRPPRARRPARRASPARRTRAARSPSSRPPATRSSPPRGPRTWPACASLFLDHLTRGATCSGSCGRGAAGAGARARRRRRRRLRTAAAERPAVGRLEWRRARSGPRRSPLARGDASSRRARWSSARSRRRAADLEPRLRPSSAGRLLGRAARSAGSRSTSATPTSRSRAAARDAAVAVPHVDRFGFGHGPRADRVDRRRRLPRPLALPVDGPARLLGALPRRRPRQPPADDPHRRAARCASRLPRLGADHDRARRHRHLRLLRVLAAGAGRGRRRRRRRAPRARRRSSRCATTTGAVRALRARPAATASTPRPRAARRWCAAITVRRRRAVRDPGAEQLRRREGGARAVIAALDLPRRATRAAQAAAYLAAACRWRSSASWPSSCSRVGAVLSVVGIGLPLLLGGAAAARRLVRARPPRRQPLPGHADPAAAARAADRAARPGGAPWRCSATGRCGAIIGLLAAQAAAPSRG